MTGSSNHSPWSSHPLGLDTHILVRPLEAPAATLSHFAAAAREEAQPGLSGARSRHNASRDAHLLINKWGLAWKVPLSYAEAEHDGEMAKFAYIKPRDFVEYLIKKAPELLMGGCPHLHDGQAHLESFWRSYRHTHPSHTIFAESHDERRLSNTFALSFHGDEGRGLKRGNTTVLMMETNLGVDTWANQVHDNNGSACSTCTLDGPTRKRIKFGEGIQFAKTEHACFQALNLKQHSYLTKFVLAALPKKDKELVDSILVEIARDFHFLFHTGVLDSHGRRWFAAATGGKGDLKWVQRVADLQRSFASAIGINKHCCHECQAGGENLPWEDSSHEPLWGPTCYTQRPCSIRPIVCHIPFESELGNDDAPYERFFRRDIFHNTKMGIYRDFVASCILCLVKLQYFHIAGESNARNVLLDRAHDHFRWFCKTTSRTPALRSFSLSFFNSPTWHTFPWVNCKGSDTSHLLAWVHTLVVGYENDPLRPDHVTILQHMSQAARAARNLQRICYSHNVWMWKTCAGALYSELHSFVKHYNACAFLALHKYQCTLFGMKPKFHMLCHAKYDILRLLQNDECWWIPNPQLWGCEMNEDVVGRISRVVRRVSARTSSSRALQLYLVKCKVVHRRFLKQQLKLKPKCQRWSGSEAPGRMIISSSQIENVLLVCVFEGHEGDEV